MLIGVPSLIFLLLSKAPVSEFNFKMLRGDGVQANGVYGLALDLYIKGKCTKVH